jgi:serine/threonine-protein kinase
MPLNSTEGALNPFFSPDSRWIGFFADGALKKVPARGGGVVTICSVADNRGGAWSEDGRIVFAPNRIRAALWQVSSAGGDPTPLTALGEGETTQRWPQMLRGGQAVLFTGNDQPNGFEKANVVVQELPNGPRKILVRGAYQGRYVPSGHLVYVHDGTLFAAPFDIQTLELAGPAVAALEEAAVNAPVGTAEISMSDTGTLAYLPAPADVNYMDAPMDWMDRAGNLTTLRAPVARWLTPRFAPDGGRLAFSLFDGAQHDIWMYEWARDAMTRLTFDTADEYAPVFTPDGRRIVFESDRGGSQNLYWQRVDGTGDVQRLTRSDDRKSPHSWHPDGRTLAFSQANLRTRATSAMLLRLDGDEPSGWRPVEPTLFASDADTPMFSPDGRWVAYVGMASAREQPEVFIRPFSGVGGPWQISADGGANPRWSRTRAEIYFRGPDARIMVAPYAVSGGSFRADKPRHLSDARVAMFGRVGSSFDLHPDGNRFVVARVVPGAGVKPDHVALIFDFFDELRRIAPPGP